MTPRERVKAALTFNNPDRQHVLPFGSIEEVHQAVIRVRQSVDDGTGGVIAQCEWGKANRQENIETVFEAWL